MQRLEFVHDAPPSKASTTVRQFIVLTYCIYISILVPMYPRKPDICIKTQSHSHTLSLNLTHSLSLSHTRILKKSRQTHVPHTHLSCKKQHTLWLIKAATTHTHTHFHTLGHQDNQSTSRAAFAHCTYASTRWLQSRVLVGSDW